MSESMLAEVPQQIYTLADFRNRHLGDTVVVCGCGESLNDLKAPERFITIGVNDVGRLFHPSYLVVLNPPGQFSGDRFRYVETTRAEYVLTQLDELKLPQARIIRFRLGRYGGTDFSDPGVLHYTQNSPYLAVCLAILMGAKRIGLIGVDFTEHHFFGKTGTHALSRQLSKIDQEYTRLNLACAKLGVEVVNLSQNSRLTAFRKGSWQDLCDPKISLLPGKSDTVLNAKESPRVFFVNYRFLSCGEVFSEGLRNAARALSLTWSDADWDDPNLPDKINQFAPDVLFVVHGRRFANRWKHLSGKYHKAVWLLDEPYEVDDTSRWSNRFDTVFANDPNTLLRHKNAHYLPTGFDPHVYRDNGNKRNHLVGFIGGRNKTRENFLLRLLDAGILSYVVGGPWRSSKLQKICLASNIPAHETARLYQQTRIVVNVFRDTHHFNSQRIDAYSLNPRIYEALACGAVVVSEYRPEAPKVFPELPTFCKGTELVTLVQHLLADEKRYQAVKEACRARLHEHTFQERLARVLGSVSNDMATKDMREANKKVIPMGEVAIRDEYRALDLDGWEEHGSVVRRSGDGELRLSKLFDRVPGTEQGLASSGSYVNVELKFEVNISDRACFIAKVHQEDQFDQTTNSYHLFCDQGHTYLAMHNQVFRYLQVRRSRWQSIVLRRYDDLIEIEVNGILIARVRNGELRRGYCFLGIKGGEVQIRNITVHELTNSHNRKTADVPEKALALPEYEICYGVEREGSPTISIVTTVYDRLACLGECIRSVQQLKYKNFEHIIVSDHPPEAVVSGILRLLENQVDGLVTYADLRKRFNNWGIAPASVGLHLARGRYLCFLSDDNGYAPDHLDPLVAALDRDHDIGFVYSSCYYAGSRMLRNPTPRPGAIDLGQPLFRKELFDRYLPGPLPFDMMAWDWHMIDAFMRQGVKWRHIDQPTFLFRLADCRRGRRR